MSAATGSAASGPPIAEPAAQWEKDGRSLFLACEFKQASRAFENAMAGQPDRAVLHYWLGKSYARLAEVSSPLSAPKNARKARRSLERTVEIDPHNDEYLRELFDSYLNSPEWLSGKLERAAALLERISPRNLARDHGFNSWLIPGKNIAAWVGGSSGQSCGRRAPSAKSSHNLSDEPPFREDRASPSVSRILPGSIINGV